MFKVTRQADKDSMETREWDSKLDRVLDRSTQANRLESLEL